MCITNGEVLDFIKEKGTVEREEVFSRFNETEKCNNHKKLRSLKLHGCIEVFEQAGKTFIKAI